MRKADIALCVHDATQGHASQLEEIHLLPIHPCDAVLCIGQSDEGNSFILPILLERGRWIGTDSQYLCSALCEFFILITQARQLRAAIRSHKAAQKRKNNGLVVSKIRKSYLVAVHILELEIGRELPRRNQFIHLGSILSLSSKSRRTFSQSISQSGYFAGSGDMNTTPKRHSQVHTMRRAQTSKPAYGRNISLRPYQKLSDPDRRSLLVSVFGFPVRDTAGNCSVLRYLAYCREEHNDRTP